MRSCQKSWVCHQAKKGKTFSFRLLHIVSLCGQSHRHGGLRDWPARPLTKMLTNWGYAPQTNVNLLTSGRKSKASSYLYTYRIWVGTSETFPQLLAVTPRHPWLRFNTELTGWLRIDNFQSLSHLPKIILVNVISPLLHMEGGGGAKLCISKSLTWI